jgi:hypothetical protein
VALEKSQGRFAASTGPTMPKLAWPPCRPLRRGHGARNIRPLRKLGADIGTR